MSVFSRTAATEVTESRPLLNKAIAVIGIPPKRVFDDKYYSDNTERLLKEYQCIKNHRCKEKRALISRK
jgi:hypothetical protein